jgi:hypothetical protein
MATTPAVVLFEFLLHRSVPSLRVLVAIAVVLTGVTMCSVLDIGVRATSGTGVLVALASLLVSAYHQVLAGAQQRALGVSGMQLLHECTPPAALAMALLVPLIDPVGAGPGTLLGYRLSAEAAAVVGCSALLGFAVMLSAFSMIGVTSALTYNVGGRGSCGCGWPCPAARQRAQQAGGGPLQPGAAAAGGRGAGRAGPGPGLADTPRTRAPQVVGYSKTIFIVLGG